MISCRPSAIITATGIVYTGHCMFTHMFIGMDKTNDPQITVYDGIDNTGTEIVPTNDYDASALGINGFTLTAPIECRIGIYIEIVCAGVVEISIGYKPRANWGVA